MDYSISQKWKRSQQWKISKKKLSEIETLRHGHSQQWILSDMEMLSEMEILTHENSEMETLKHGWTLSAMETLEMQTLRNENSQEWNPIRHGNFIPSTTKCPEFPPSLGINSRVLEWGSGSILDLRAPHCRPLEVWFFRFFLCQKFAT